MKNVSAFYIQKKVLYVRLLKNPSRLWGGAL